jgi:hypothetical protein
LSIKAIKDGYEIQLRNYGTGLRHNNPVIKVTIDIVWRMTPSPLAAGHFFKMLLERLGDNLQVKDTQELQALLTQPDAPRPEPQAGGDSAKGLEQTSDQP